jgi:phospholipid/cholesterol/gamma-HCH transport system substrate-binding protein
MQTAIRQREPFHRVHRTFFVGIFVLVPAVAIPLLLLYTLGKADLFQHWRVLHAVYSSSHGLAQGADVTLSDIRVGYVTRVELTDEGKALVTFKILVRHAPLVRKDSKAMLRQKSMVVGDWLIALTQGSIGYAIVEEGDTLVGDPPAGLDRLLDRVASMAGTLESILKEVEQGHGLIGHLVKGDTLAHAVDAAVGDFRRALRTGDRAFNRADQAFIKFNDLGAAGIGLADSAKAFIDSLGPAISGTRALLQQLNQSSTRLPPLFKQAQVDLVEIEVLLKGLENHWLLRRAVNKGKEAQASEPAPDSGGVPQK